MRVGCAVRLAQGWQDRLREWFPRFTGLCDPGLIEVARSSDYVSPLGAENPEDPLGPPGETYGIYVRRRRAFPFGMDALKRWNLISEFDFGTGSRTRHEMQQNVRPGWDPTAYRAARGIGWVTVLPTAQIGGTIGVDHLKATGKFFEVSRLPGELCWLQVSETIEEYDDDAYSRGSKAYEALLDLDLDLE